MLYDVWTKFAGEKVNKETYTRDYCSDLIEDFEELAVKRGVRFDTLVERGEGTQVHRADSPLAQRYVLFVHSSLQ